LEDHEAAGLSTVKEALETSTYAVKEVLLANSEKMPVECEAYVVAGPKNPPTEREVKMLQDYLAQGGKLIAMLGPRSPKEWKALTKTYGVEVRQDLIIDPLQERNPTVVVTRNYAQDVDVTSSFKIVTFFPESSSISVPMQTGKEGVSVKTFVSSEGQAYAKAGDMKNIRNIVRSGNDLRGPIPMGVLIQKKVSLAPKEPALPRGLSVPVPGTKIPSPPSGQGQGFWKLPSLVNAAYADEAPKDEGKKADDKETTVILFSNDTFVINGFARQTGNLDLFLNSINFVMKDKDMIGIRPRDIRSTYLQIGPEDIRKVWGVILILSGLFALFGIRAARRRSLSV
jgi:hypothetical protein